MSAEIAFVVPPKTEILETVTSDGGFIIHNDELQAVILPITEQKNPHLILIKYSDSPLNKPSDQKLGYIPFPENLMPEFLEVLGRLEILNGNGRNMVSLRRRQEMLGLVEIQLQNLEKRFPEGNTTNKLISAFRKGFEAFSQKPELQSF